MRVVFKWISCKRYILTIWQCKLFGAIRVAEMFLLSAKRFNKLLITVKFNLIRVVTQRIMYKWHAFNIIILRSYFQCCLFKNLVLFGKKNWASFVRTFILFILLIGGIQRFYIWTERGYTPYLFPKIYPEDSAEEKH